MRRTFLRDLILLARIGADASEVGRTQRIRLNIDMFVADEGGVGPDELSRVVDYGDVHATVVAEVGRGHVRLVETLAERLAGAILRDERVRKVTVRIEKLDILPEGASAGVEIVRTAEKQPTATGFG